MNNSGNNEEFVIGKEDLNKITLNGKLAEFAAEVANGIVKLTKPHPLVKPVNPIGGKIFVDQVLRTVDRCAIYGDADIKNKNGDKIKNFLPQSEPAVVEEFLKMYTANGFLKIIGADGSIIVFVPTEVAKKIRDKKSKSSLTDIMAHRPAAPANVPKMSR